MTSTNNSMIEQNSATQNYRKTPEIVLLSTILFIITLIAFFGNAIVIATICCFQKWRDEISNLLIVNLAITDLFTSVAVMVPTMVSFTANKWTMGDIMCNITCACNYCLIIVSMLTLSFISIVRYHGVINSLQYPVLITRVRVTMMIGYSWFQGITFSMVPVILGWIKYDYWEATCAIQWYHQRHNAVYYVIIAFIFCFLLPTIVIFGCYGLIIREVKKSSTRILSITVPNRQEGTQSTQISNETSKFISSFIVVFIAFFICMTPFCVTKLIKIVKKESIAVPPYVNLIATWIGYASSAINPLLYSLFRKDFREAFKKLISIATNSNR